MKNAWPSDTWPAIPVRMFSPSAAMAKMNTVDIGRIQSLSPRNLHERDLVDDRQRERHQEQDRDRDRGERPSS